MIVVIERYALKQSNEITRAALRQRADQPSKVLESRTAVSLRLFMNGSAQESVYDLERSHDIKGAASQEGELHRSSPRC